MARKRRYHLRSYLRSSLRIVPVVAFVPGQIFAALRMEHDLLDRMLEKLYVLPEDLALARILDSQGLGGSTDTAAPKWAA